MTRTNFFKWIVYLFSLLLFSHSSYAALSSANAKFLGITNITTTGTASASIVNYDSYSAYGEHDLGDEVSGSDMLTFDSVTSSFGEGTAVNNIGSQFDVSSTAISTTDSYSLAQTETEVNLLLSGTGTVTIDIAYELFVSSNNNMDDPSVIAEATIAVFDPFTFLNPNQEILLTAPVVTGDGSSQTINSTIQLTFGIDNPVDYSSLFVGIRAESQSVEPTPIDPPVNVPLPMEFLLILGLFIILFSYKPNIGRL